MTKSLFTAFAFCALLIGAAAVSNSQAMHMFAKSTSWRAEHLPTVTIESIKPNTSSFVVSYDAVSGAADYRVREVEPNGTLSDDVKYAGLLYEHDKSGHYTDSTPELRIEVNGYPTTEPHKFVVEAVDQLGPFPPGNLYTGGNKPALKKWNNADSMLGSNMGMTLDGLMSTNGQGPCIDKPQAIARSAVFIAGSSGKPALPSGPDATQVMFEPWLSGTVDNPTPTNLGLGEEKFIIKTPVTTWTAQTDRTDTDNTKVFITKNHLMDVVFDGGTPSVSGQPLHVGHGGIFYAPARVFDFSGGRILHVTGEWDGHVGPRRWVQMFIVPADRPIDQFNENVGPMNKTNQLMAYYIDNNTYRVTLDSGFDGKGKALDTDLIGHGNSLHWTEREVNGTGFDQRVRYDWFISATHTQIYEGGVLVSESDYPKPGLTFSKARIYFAHYCYHTAVEHSVDIPQYAPYEKFWLEDVPFSDERHYNNMGAEVLPASTPWSSMASRVGAQ